MCKYSVIREAKSGVYSSKEDSKKLWKACMAQELSSGQAMPKKLTGRLSLVTAPMHSHLILSQAFLTVPDGFVGLHPPLLTLCKHTVLCRVAPRVLQLCSGECHF